MNSQSDNKSTAEQQPGAEGCSRRDFLKGTIAAGAVVGGGLGGFYFGYERAIGSPLRVGVIGTGDEGSVLIGAITPDFVEVKAIADIRPYSVWRAFNGDHSSDAAIKARPGLMAKYDWKTEDQARKHVKVYGSYQQLIENAKADGLEAVIIALPLHLHAPAAIAAMRAGLHVLTEKLMGHSVHECKEMARTAKQTNLLLATGHQRHYNILYANAVDSIQRGLLGQVHYIRAQWHRGNLPGHDSWQQPMPKEAKPNDPQADALLKKLKSWKSHLARADGREIDLWQVKVNQLRAQIADVVDAAKYGYQQELIKDGSGKVVYDAPPIEELIRWRLWDRTGGGLMAELASHQLDAAGMFVAAAHGGKKQHPLSIAVSADRPLFPPDRDIDGHIYCIVDFPAPGYDAKDPIKRLKKIGVQYAAVNGNGFGGYGEIVYGTKRTMLIERERELSIVPDPASEKMSITAGKADALDTQASAPINATAAKSGGGPEVSRGYTEEIEHWAWCIRHRSPENQPRCGPVDAAADAAIALVGNLSASQGRYIEFKPEWFDIDSDETPEGIKPDLNRYKKT
ncbi:MAG: Gfo/Idh/MocA family protein [Thermoguttaceae bacterium]